MSDRSNPREIYTGSTPTNIDKPELSPPRNGDGRIMVVYYSRTGRTRRVAERLARELGGTAISIRESVRRRGLFGYLRSLLEAVTGQTSSIDPWCPVPQPSDLVILGTPVWGWHLSPPVREFARLHAERIRRVAFFCTMGGSGDEAVFRQLATVLGREPEDTLALTEREVALLESAPASAKISHFVQRLRAGASSAVPSGQEELARA